MDFLNDIIRDRGGDLVAQLTSKAGFSTEQAERFVPAAGSSVAETLASRASEMDLTNLASADSVGMILKHLDVGAIAKKAGVTAEQGAKGLNSLLPMLMQLIGDHAKDASGLLALLGGGGGLGKNLGALKGMAGKFLGGR
jgi:hypothetical protein